MNLGVPNRNCAPCTFTFSIKACNNSCCIDETLFENTVAHGFNYDLSCESITVQTDNLEDCDFVNWRWGDGSITQTTSGNARNYEYNITGVTEMEFEVCMEVYRFNQTGNICVSGFYCERIVIESCCSCEGAVAIWHENNKKVTRNYHLYID